MPLRGTGAASRVRTAAEAAVAVALFLALFYGEVLFLGRTIQPLGIGYGGVMGAAGPWGYSGEVREDRYRWDRGASTWQIEPAAREIARQWAAGSLPLWSSYQGLGAPLLANAQSGALDLLRLPAFVWSGPGGWDAAYLLRAAVGLVLAWAFGRQVGLARPAAWTLAVAYSASGFMAIMGNNQFVGVYALLPALLWATEAILAGMLLRGMLGLALAVALSTYAGMPESSLLTFSYAVLWGLFRLSRARSLSGRAQHGPATAGNGASQVSSGVEGEGCPPRGMVHPPSARHAMTALALGWAAGLLLAAPLIVPFAEYLQNAASIHTPDQRLGLAALPLADGIYLGVPFLDGLPGEIGPAGRAVGVKSFVGLAVMALAAAGLTGLGHDRPGRAGWVAAIGGALVAAKQFGVPLVNEVGRLPVFELTLIADWSGPLLAFSLAYLAALAVHRTTTAVQAGPGGAMRSFGAGAAGLAVFGAGALLARGASLSDSGLSTFVQEAAFGIAALGGLVAVAVARRHRASAGRSPLGPVRPTGGHARHWLAASVAWLPLAVVAIDLVRLWPHGVYQDRADALAPPPFVRLLQQRRIEEGPSRVLAAEGLLFPNLATAFGLDDLRSVDGLYPARYIAYLRRFITDVRDRYTARPAPNEEGPTPFAGSRWLDLANVRYLVLPAGSGPPDGGAGRYRSVYDGEVALFENLQALPRAFLVGQVQAASSLAAAMDLMERAGFDPRRVAVVELAGPELRLDGGSGGSVQSIRDQGGQLEARVTADGDALLVVTDLWYPGWRAEVDGREVPIYPADLAFRAVPVPAGQHTVRLTYQPASFVIGAALAAAGAVGLLAATLLMRGRSSKFQVPSGELRVAR